MNCQMCGSIGGGIEGFTNIPPEMAVNLPITAKDTTNNVQAPIMPPYMRGDCNYGAQACIYTAQGTLVCGGDAELGAGPTCDAKQTKPFFGVGMK